VISPRCTPCGVPQLAFASFGARLTDSRQLVVRRLVRWSVDRPSDPPSVAHAGGPKGLRVLNLDNVAIGVGDRCQDAQAEESAEQAPAKMKEG
jgi:hypothetical protein